ncbi:DUF3592 domain-containing protein [Nonomuraea pusilla]|uniref:DUF3592 domain-containing protein n=1 Tax=Nonomuraea pusilla TaxID=46177 RepID=UPI0033205425
MASLMTLVIVSCTLLISVGVWLPFLVVAHNGRRLLATGLPAQAVVESMADTGMSVNHRPVVSFVLQVRLPSGETYRVTHRQSLPRIPMGVVATGTVLPVKVDPQRYERLRIDWFAWRPAHHA